MRLVLLLLCHWMHTFRLKIAYVTSCRHMYVQTQTRTPRKTPLKAIRTRTHANTCTYAHLHRCKYTWNGLQVEWIWLHVDCVGVIKKASIRYIAAEAVPPKTPTTTTTVLISRCWLSVSSSLCNTHWKRRRIAPEKRRRRRRRSTHTKHIAPTRNIQQQTNHILFLYR